MNTSDPGLYIHFPWCVKKCPYCDFNSHALSESLPSHDYVDALLSDLDDEMIRAPDVTAIHSIFMGGGTPSLFPATDISRLLSGIHSRLSIDGREITLEANPGTFDQSNFSGYYDAGVNRISIGAQSFNVSHLEVLGRIHQPDEITKAHKGARQAGFKRINLDLMFGLPGQCLSEAMDDLQLAIDLGPEHISWYQLTIEQNTVFHRYPPQLPDDDLLADMTEAGHALLQLHGYKQYEVSAFAQPGEQSQHNLNYWQFGDYLGIGAGAHGKLTTDQGIERTTKTRVPSDYLAQPRRRSTFVHTDELATEFLLNALRLAGGFELTLFEARTGFHRSVLDNFLQQATAKKMIAVNGATVTPTILGQRFLNDLLLLYDAD